MHWKQFCVKMVDAKSLKYYSSASNVWESLVEHLRHVTNSSHQTDDDVVRRVGNVAPNMLLWNDDSKAFRVRENR